MNYELQFQQSFAKLRRILGSNYAREGRIKKCVTWRRGRGLYRGGVMLQVNVATDSPCAWCMTSPLGTPRGRYDECSG
jgi:hypothetical protein